MSFSTEQARLERYIEERGRVHAELCARLQAAGFEQEGSVLSSFYKGAIQVHLWSHQYGGSMLVNGNVRLRPRWRNGTIRMVEKAIGLAREAKP